MSSSPKISATAATWGQRQHHNLATTAASGACLRHLQLPPRGASLQQGFLLGLRWVSQRPGHCTGSPSDICVVICISSGLPRLYCTVPSHARSPGGGLAQRQSNAELAALKSWVQMLVP